MTLKLYQRKRNFKKTPEPKGKTTSNKKIKNLYVIQKHAASHLHYDFRLELNGVLLSWAVPKGPCLDPTVRRLAMHVEDHPVAYGSFEGIIPKGQYGGGTVMLWDKGTWVSDDANPVEAYKKGSLTFRLKAKKLNGAWKLIRINRDGKTWLLIKIRDSYAKSLQSYDILQEQPDSVLSNQSIDEIANNYKKVWGKKGLIKQEKSKITKTLKKHSKLNVDLHLKKSSFPKVIHPQLATLVDHVPHGKNWLHEIKFDGYRLIAFKKGKTVQLYTRNQNNWTSKFKSVAKELEKLAVNNLVLDGEVVALDENQHSDFQLLQNAIKDRGQKFYYYIFDLLYYDHFDLTPLPLLERKKILEKIISNQDSDILRYSEHILGSGKDIFAKSCELGLEGIVSKMVDSPYVQARSQTWVKIKCIKRQEFVIGGFNKSSKRDYFASLMLGTFNKNGELEYHGNVGTGFTQKSLKTLHTLLSKYITRKIPFAKKPPASRNSIWVKPVIMAEVEFTEWTDSGTLRHPSFKGIRSDKPAKNIIKEVEKPIENVIKNTSKKKTSMTEYPLTHPEKIIYTEDNISKNDIAEYYERIHKWILPYIVSRPLSLLRCPSSYKECFYQKHIQKPYPPGLYGVTIKEKTKKHDYLYLEDLEGLLSLAQLNVLEIHPWGSRVEDVDYPDNIVFDLDPAPHLPWKRVVAAAFEVKEILADFKLKSFVKSTGGKGLHVVIPMKPEYTWDEVKTFSQVLVNYIVMNNPKEYIGKMTKAKRTNKIFVDYLRNQRGATAVAAYSLRAKRHATVATPLDWNELTNDIRDTLFTIETLPQRLEQLKKDPWHDYFKIKQSLHLDKLG